ncbi:helix-turn-helix transcriptional regulator [Kitasatospora purpeofusca]|uniref:helix-turn-helix domain-containing protein n=1 Tax=Kitasatospora purpeofusca TaxID=67352 RepID=UPI0036D22AC9
MSNKQIGAKLYLSPRTVSTHLYQVFPKLGITSRAPCATRWREWNVRCADRQRTDAPDQPLFDAGAPAQAGMLGRRRCRSAPSAAPPPPRSPPRRSRPGW